MSRLRLSLLGLLLLLSTLLGLTEFALKHLGVSSADHDREQQGDVQGHPHGGFLPGVAGFGQVAVACALAYRDFRFAETDWRGSRPKLAAWFASFAARPSMTSTEPSL